MLVQTACDALRSGHVLELHYDGSSRLVEVHAVGFTADDEPIAHVWELGPEGVAGWKMLPLKDARGALITQRKSLAPRPGYEPGDRDMNVITCQL
ncbi:MAG TPA: hypothetical protein VIQ05_01485 [Tardiphaga sp.]